MGYEKIRSSDVLVDDIVKRKKNVEHIAEVEETVGDGSFSSSDVLSNFGTPTDLITGFVDADLNPDIITADESTGTIRVALGNANGSFQSNVSYDAGGAV